VYGAVHWYVLRPPRVRSSRIAAGDRKIKHPFYTLHRIRLEKRMSSLPSNFMPILRHFSNRQAGHFFLVLVVTGHSAPLIHT